MAIMIIVLESYGKASEVTGTLWCALLAAKQPRSLTAARLGVGACLWDGAFVLTAFLLTQPPATFTGDAAPNLPFGSKCSYMPLFSLCLHASLTVTPPAFNSVGDGDQLCPFDGGIRN